MTKEQARNKIIKILKDHNWYGVIHNGHSGRYFHVMDLTKVKSSEFKSEIYGAIYEEFDDKYDYNNELVRFKYDYEGKDVPTWNKILTKLTYYISSDYKLFYDTGDPDEYKVMKIRALNEDDAIRKLKRKIKNASIQAHEYVIGSTFKIKE